MASSCKCIKNVFYRCRCIGLYGGLSESVREIASGVGSYLVRCFCNNLNLSFTADQEMIRKELTEQYTVKIQEFQRRFSKNK